MTGIVLFFFASAVAVFASILGYGVGRANGYADAMKENGWRPTLNGWYKETLTPPPPPKSKASSSEPRLQDYVDPSDFE